MNDASRFVHIWPLQMRPVEWAMGKGRRSSADGSRSLFLVLLKMLAVLSVCLESGHRSAELRTEL